MQVSGDGGSDCDSAAIVVARSLFLPEPHTHTRGRHHLWRPQWTFSRSRPFFRPLVTSWFGRVGQVGGRKKPRRGGFTIHLIGSGPSSDGWGTGGHC